MRRPRAGAQAVLVGHPSRYLHAALALWLAAAPGAPRAADLPTIREIVFEGNGATQPSTMLREMSVRVGDPADAAMIERSRQGVQNLGLFRSVDARQEELADGVRLVIEVREKYYMIPAPRADYNSDGEYSYGVQLRWKNVWGLNHSLRGTAKYKDRQEVGRGAALEYSLGYEAPFVFDTPYGVDLNARHTREPAEQPLAFDDVTTTARLVLDRSLWRANPDGENLSVGLGVQWLEQATYGPAAPEAQGHALAPLLRASYGWTHNHLYSEIGQNVAVEVSSASTALLGDYSFTEASARYGGSWPLGDTRHQTLGLFASAGLHHGGTLKGEPPFELGGVDSLRGYRKQTERGEEHYLLGVEVLRPLWKPWLRGMAFVEAGDVSGGPLAAGGPYADAGVGVRLRLTWFVNLEFSAGIAWPLRDAGDGGGPQFFVGGYR